MGGSVLGQWAGSVGPVDRINGDWGPVGRIGGSWGPVDRMGGDRWGGAMREWARTVGAGGQDQRGPAGRTGEGWWEDR